MREDGVLAAVDMLRYGVWGDARWRTVPIGARTLDVMLFPL